MKRFFALFVILISLFTITVSAQNYPSYTIDAEYNEIESPPAYVPITKIDNSVLDGKSLGEITDIASSHDYLYIINRQGEIIIFDKSFKMIKKISQFTNKGQPDKFNEPSGITIAPDGDIYVADTENSRIVRLGSSGNLKKIHSRPEVTVLDSDYVYKPVKIGVDRTQRMYVVAQGVNRGLMELDVDGNFSGFFGAPKVLYDPFQIIWKSILSQTASETMEKFVPTEFSNLFIDDGGFVYTTIRANDATKMYKAVRNKDQETVKSVMRLSASGTDILNRYGDIPIVGDVNFEVPPKNDGSGASQETHNSYNPSAFIDIAVEPSGTYYCLDALRSRVFAYDSDGNMLYAFGQKGTSLGSFTNPNAITIFNDNLLISDSLNGSITVFGKTDYGQMIDQAAYLFSQGDYKTSLEKWEDVNKYNANLSIAYIGIGKCQYRLKDYKASYESLKIANEVTYCTKAFQKYRHEVISKWASPIFGSLVVVILLLIVFAGYRFISGKKGASD